MGVVNITNIWTADPVDIWTPQPYFDANEAFAIVIEVNLQANPPYLDYSFAATWIMGTPRMDPWTTSWYTVLPGNDAGLMPTVVNKWNFQWDYRHNGKNFIVWISWDHYADAVSQIFGPEKYDGIFYVLGTIAAEGTPYFGVSDKYWYRVQNLSQIP